MRAAARTLPTPMSRRVRSCRSSCSSWLMASGMARSHRSFARAPSRSSAPGDRRAGCRRRGPVPAGDGGPGGAPLRDAPVAAPARLCARLGGGPAVVPGRRQASVPAPVAGAAAATSPDPPAAARPGRGGRSEGEQVEKRRPRGPQRPGAFSPSAPDPGWRWILAGYRTPGGRGRSGRRTSPPMSSSAAGSTAVITALRARRRRGRQSTECSFRFVAANTRSSSP